MMKHYKTLTWPQTAEIPFPRISILNVFWGKMPPDPVTGHYIRRTVSRTPSLKSCIHPNGFHFSLLKNTYLVVRKIGSTLMTFIFMMGR